MKTSQKIILTLSIILWLAVVGTGFYFYRMYHDEMLKAQNSNKLLQIQIRLADEDNVLLQQQIDEIDEKIRRFQEDDRYQELTLWKRLREQLQSQLSS